MAQHRGTGGHVYKTAPRNFEIMALMGSFPKKGKGEHELAAEGITDGKKISFEEEKEEVEEEGEEDKEETGEMGEADEELTQDGASVSDDGSEDVEYDQVLDGASGLFWQRAPAPPHRSGHHARWHPHFGVAHHHARLYRQPGRMYPRLVEGSHNNSRSKSGGWWGGMGGAGHYSRGHGRRRRPLRNQHQPRPHHHQVELY